LMRLTKPHLNAILRGRRTPGGRGVVVSSLVKQKEQGY
jgi:hypothetical protein